MTPLASPASAARALGGGPIGSCTGMRYEEPSWNHCPHCTQCHSFQSILLDHLEEHTFLHRVQFLYPIVCRERVGSHRQIAPKALQAHQTAGREIFVLDLSRATFHLATIDGEGDKSPWADARLTVLHFSRRFPEGAAVRTSNGMLVQGELRPSLTCRPGQNLANPEGLHAAGEGCRLNRPA